MNESLLGLDSWIAAAEEVSLQTASEGGKRRCRRDVLRQTVPNRALLRLNSALPVADLEADRLQADDRSPRGMWQSRPTTRCRGCAQSSRNVRSRTLDRPHGTDCLTICVLWQTQLSFENS